jgi:Insertion element 4 transposase N-terminal
MSFYPVMPPDVTSSAGEDAALGLLGRAGMVAVRAADLGSPCRRGLGRDGRTALTAAGAGRIRPGDLVVWLKPVAVTRAVVRRDGRVQAAGHPADHARLGVAEERLDELTGTPGVIDEIARTVTLAGRVKGAARRAMSPALGIRFTLLMTLTPDADYTEVMDILLGDLALVPWQRPCTVPTAAAACTWREALGPAPLERLQDLVLGGIDGEHRSRDYRAVTVGDLEAGSIDGSLIRVPDTPANREAFGSAGTADDSSPFPQLRELRVSAASTRATLGVTTGPSGAGAARGKGEAEQALLDTALKDHRQVFTPWRLWIMDRNYPGVARIKALPEAGTHVLIRVRDGITLRRAGDFLPDGSYLATMSGGGITLAVRVIEYTVAVAGRDAPELFCLITECATRRCMSGWRWETVHFPAVVAA